MSENKSKKELQQLIQRYVPYWPYFVASVIVCVIIAEIYLHYATPVYDISASILIKDSDKNDNKDSQFLSSMDVFSSKKIVDNETQILHSHTLMDEVVKTLGLYAPVSEEGSLHNTSAYLNSPIAIRLKYPDSLQETKEKVIFKFNQMNNGVQINGKQYPLNSWELSPWGIIKFIPNPKYNKSMPATTGEMFFSLIGVSKVADGLLNNLGVSPSSKLSTVVSLDLKDPVPQRGEDILNELIRFYNLETLKDKNKLASNSLAFLDERLHYVTADLDSIETELQQFKSSKGVVDLSEQGKLILGSVETNDQKISEINVQLAVLKQVKNYVEDNSSTPGIIPSTSGVNDNVLSNYLSNLYDSQIQYDKLSKTTAKNNPVLLSLQAQIDKIRPTILQYVQNQISTLETSKTNLQQTTGQYSSIIKTIPGKERELLEISRQQSIKNNLYTYLLQKREEAALSYASSVSDVRVVDSAHASIQPVKPKHLNILAAAFVFGLGLPFAFVSLKRKVLTKNDIDGVLDFPIIGEVAYTNSKDDIISEDDKKGFIVEQFRQIRTALSSFINLKQFKKILVTSSIAAEGKSFIASNLAHNLALAGKKTVVVELDLRKPRLSQLFNLKNQIGVSAFLAGKANISDIIYSTALNDNFYLIPAGELPPSPSELLMNGRLQTLLDDLENKFDVIIVETAPVGLFTDSYIVSELCDITLFVVRYMVTPVSELNALTENMKTKDLKRPSIIFNGVKSLYNNSYSSKYANYHKV